MAKSVQEAKAKPKKKRGKGKAKGPKTPKAESVIFYPKWVDVVQIDKSTKRELLPSLFDAVGDLLPATSRGHTVKILSERYKCSIKTVDRAIALWKTSIREELAQDRPDWIGSLSEKYNLIFKRALRSGKEHAARGALDSLAKITGVMRPDVLLQLSGADRPADELQTQAEELRAIADGRRKQRAA